MSLPRLSSIPVRQGAYTPVGSMNNAITLYNVPDRTSDGGFADPTEFGVSFANIRALQSRELYKAQEIVQDVTHQVTIPYMAGVARNMTIGFGGRTFTIQDVQDPDERQFELRLLCVERSQNA